MQRIKGFGQGYKDITFGTQTAAWDGSGNLSAYGAITATAGSINFVRPAGWGHSGWCLIHQTRYGGGAGWWEVNYFNFNTQVARYPFLNTYYAGAQVVTLSVGEYDGAYRNINFTGTFSAPLYDGNVGGVIALMASNRIYVSGQLNATGKGYRGALQYAYTSGWDGGQLDAWRGDGWQYNMDNNSGPYGNAGGGGYNHRNGYYDASGGGGGANVANGGNGGLRGGGGNNAYPGYGGTAYGSADLLTMPMGGGGGQGGSRPVNGGTGGAGGNGGGIVILIAPSIIIDGSIVADGNNGGVGTVGSAGGGGGAGGSVVLYSPWIQASTNRIYARAGAGGAAGGNGGAGGAGSLGRVMIYYGTGSVVNGTAPTYNGSNITFLPTNLTASATVAETKGQIRTYGYMRTSPDENEIIDAGVRYTKASERGSVYFDGGSKYIDAPAISALYSPTTFSAEVWICPTATAGDWRCVMGNATWADASQWNFNIHLTPEGYVWVDMYNTSGVGHSIQDQIPVRLNVWTLITVTYDGSYIRLFRNARMTGIVAHTGQMRNCTVRYLFGGWYAGDANWFAGYLHRARIYNRALKYREVHEHYQGVYTDESNLQLFYKFNEPVGASQVLDYSGNGRHSAGLSCAFDPTKWIGEKKSILTDALDCGEDRGFAYLTNTISMANDWSIAFWFKYPLSKNATTGWHTFSRGSTNDHQIIVQQSNMELGTWISGITPNFRGSGFIMSTLSQGWHHMVCSASGGVQRFYIDGSLVGTSNAKSSTEMYSFGNYQSGAQSWGTFSELRLYTRALSATEASEIYSGVYSNTANLVGKYDFTEEFGQYAFDRSGNENHLILSYNAHVGHPYFTASNRKTLKDDLLGTGMFCYGDSMMGLPASPTHLITTYSVFVRIYLTTGLTMPYWMAVYGKGGRNFNMWLGNCNLGDGAGTKPFVHHRWHDTASTNSGAVNAVFNLNEWVDICITNDGVTGKTYINGVLTQTGAVTGSLVADALPLSLGKNLDGSSNSEKFVGYIQRLRLYNRALSLAEIGELRAWREVSETGLVAQYFDNVMTNRLNDMSGQGNGGFVTSPQWDSMNIRVRGLSPKTLYYAKLYVRNTYDFLNTAEVSVTTKSDGSAVFFPLLRE